MDITSAGSRARSRQGGCVARRGQAAAEEDGDDEEVPHERRGERGVARPTAVLPEAVQDLHDSPNWRRPVHAPAVEAVDLPVLRVHEGRHPGAACGRAARLQERRPASPAVQYIMLVSQKQG